MKINLYALVLFSVFIVVFASNSRGRATAARAGNTGAPGDQMSAGTPVTCQFCHNSNNIRVDMNIQVLDEENQPIANYLPGKTYKLLVELNPTAGNPAGYGFQLIPLLDKNNTDAKGLNNPSANANIVTLANGRTYAEHHRISSSSRFEMDWTAPEQGSGAVTFYAAGNGVNGNGSSSGDGSASATLTIQESTLSGIQDFLSTPKIKIFPNPASQFLYYQFEQGQLNHCNLSLFNSEGKIVLSQVLHQPDGIIHLSEIPEGVYACIVRDVNGKLTCSSKLIVLKK